MSNYLYPNAIRGLTYTIEKGPEFSTKVQATATGVSTRLMRHRNPIWHWSLIYDYLKDMAEDLSPGFEYTDMRYLLNFIMRHKGKYEDFLLDDPDDNYVGPAMKDGAPNLEAQLQLVQDRETGIWYSPLQRIMGGQFFEDIAELNLYDDQISIYADGVLTEEYLIDGPGLAIPGYSFAGLYLVWDSKPTEPITAQFRFYWRVRFEEDRADLEKFTGNLLGAIGNPGLQVWTIGGSQAKGGAGSVRLQSCRPTWESGIHAPTSEMDAIEVPIELFSQGLSGWDVGAHTFARTLFYFDPGDYDQVIHIPIEGVATLSGAEIEIQIRDAETETVCGSLTIPSGSNIRWVRTGEPGITGEDFVPYAAEKRKYAVHISSNNILLDLHSVCLIVRQLKTMTKTRIQRVMIHADNGSGSVGWGGILPLIMALEDLGGNQLYWRQGFPRAYPLFEYQPSRVQATSVSFSLELCGEIMWGWPVDAALFDLSKSGDPYDDEPDDMVPGTKCTVTKYSGWTISDNNADCVSVEFAKEAFEEGGIYEARVRSREFMFASKVFGIAFYEKLVGVTQFEVPMRISRSSNNYQGYHRKRITKNKAISEICGYAAAPEPGDVSLGDDGLNDQNPLNPAAVSGSAQTFGSETKVIRRTDQLDVVAKDMFIGMNTGLGETAQMSSQYVFIPWRKLSPGGPFK